ncbi:MAG: protease inhibitor I42 family protein [Candidatus Methanoperedens sp.]|nr:protease inhibitor I42 family protein [Candidatus Methanoperedens sp.]MCZ7404423.1 protease inhibitor I42 family protein [Candidatus Methanoperedens sp.]
MKVHPDPDFPIEVTPGKSFTISFESIPSSGYTWLIEYDSKMIDFHKPKKFVFDPSKIGGIGQEIFEFKAKQPGETQIKAKYQRVWEKAPLEIKIFRIRILQ